MDQLTVRSARARAGLTGDELAALTGIPPSVISRIERGHARLTPLYASRIGCALGIDPQALSAGQQRVHQTCIDTLSARVAAVRGSSL